MPGRWRVIRGIVIIDDRHPLWDARAGLAAGRIRPRLPSIAESSRRRRHELHHPDQVVGGGDEVGPEAVALQPR
jgi:hypothetical protein